MVVLSTPNRFPAASYFSLADPAVTEELTASYFYQSAIGARHLSLHLVLLTAVAADSFGLRLSSKQASISLVAVSRTWSW